MSRKECPKSRRDFLRNSFFGLAAYSITSSIKNEEKTANDSKIKKKIYRTLGRTGIEIPIVSMGAPRTINLAGAALDAGMTYLDTAYRYGAGSSESLLGEVLKDRSRESVVVGTKICGLRDNRSGLPPENISTDQFWANFRRQVETSMKRLRVDYLDILFFHGVENPEIMGLPLIKDILQKLKEEGKTRFLGVTFHHKELELIPAAVEEKIYDVILTSYNFRQPHREQVGKAIAQAANAGLGVMAMKVMAGVYWDKERKNPIDPKAALKWVLQNEHIHTAIPGITSFQQLETDLLVMENLTLTPQEKENLRLGEDSEFAGLYCAQCGRCRSQCRYGLDIPTMMRSYMYAYGYKDPLKAKTTLQQKPQDDITCRECARCEVSCTMGFDVSNRMQDIIRLMQVPDEFLG